MGPRIVVIGAGIGGLAVAAALGQQGARCVVVERNGALPRSTGGIQIAPNGSAVLHRLRLAGALAGAFRPAGRELRRWRDDTLLGAVDLGPDAERRYGSPYYTLRRIALCRMLLLAARRSSEVRFGVPCVGVEDRGDRAVVRLGDGTRLVADAAIGADGLHSIVRRAVVADRVRYGGHVVYRATVPARQLPEDVRDRVVVRLGPGGHCVSYPLDGGGTVNVVVAVQAEAPPPENWNVPAREVLDALAGWHPAARALVAAAGRFHRHGVFDRVRPAWQRGHVVLLGDAAHPLAPFLAQGACQALEDAAALADRLATGFAGYAEARSTRVNAIATASRMAGLDDGLPDGPDQQARDERLATVALADHDWLYRPPSGVRA